MRTVTIPRTRVRDFSIHPAGCLKTMLASMRETRQDTKANSRGRICMATSSRDYAIIGMVLAK
jgi:hypothetical protein